MRSQFRVGHGYNILAEESKVKRRACGWLAGILSLSLSPSAASGESLGEEEEGERRPPPPYCTTYICIRDFINHLGVFPLVGGASFRALRPYSFRLLWVFFLVWWYVCITVCTEYVRSTHATHCLQYAYTHKHITTTTITTFFAPSTQSAKMTDQTGSFAFRSLLNLPCLLPRGSHPSASSSRAPQPCLQKSSALA